MATAKRIESIGIDKLIAHPANPNRMSDASFRKLASHIERTGNYEPVIVRPHPKQNGCYEIINGHHRARALKKLGCKTCDCIEWQVDDAETLILLATLNRLAGADVLEKKSELIKSLSDRFSTKELAKHLPDTKSAIERLSRLAVDKAISSVAPEGAETAAQRRARAITKIAEVYLQRSEEGEHMSFQRRLESR
jgi:ParB family chromosome partitioning protein